MHTDGTELQTVGANFGRLEASFLRTCRVRLSLTGNVTCTFYYRFFFLSKIRRNSFVVPIINSSYIFFFAFLSRLVYEQINGNIRGYIGRRRARGEENYYHYYTNTVASDSASAAAGGSDDGCDGGSSASVVDTRCVLNVGADTKMLRHLGRSGVIHTRSRVPFASYQRGRNVITHARSFFSRPAVLTFHDQSPTYSRRDSTRAVVAAATVAVAVAVAVTSRRRRRNKHRTYALRLRIARACVRIVRALVIK